MSRRIQYTSLAMLCLFALRLGTGWHFFREGSKKLQNPNFTSKYFLQAAKGPLAGFFHGMIPDRYGVKRLNSSSTIAEWKKYRATIQARMKFDDAKKKKAASILKRRTGQLNDWFADRGGDIQKHQFEVKRLQAAQAEPISEIEFRQKWIQSQQSKLQNAPNSWLADLDKMSAAYQNDLLELVEKDKRSRAPRLVGYKKTFVDHAVTYTTFGVGCLLMLGLLTRPAALIGAGFLCSVMLTQPFWAYGAELGYAYYQFVEILALLVLAATAAGRFWGVDFFLESIWNKVFGRNSEAQQ